MFRCDRCESLATVHMTEIRQGKTTERHLCEECARVLHVPQASKELQKLLKSFEPAHSLTRRRKGKDKGKACPECGMTFTEFRQHGRFGCENDYRIFGKEVAKLLERIHGSSNYTGPAPRGGRIESGETLDALAEIRAKLRDAIDSEDYEQAAKLRDEIRRMESEADVERSGDRPEVG